MTMMKRKCIYCNQPGGVGKRELRPYGPGGSDVCAGCVFDGPPERKIEAEKQFAARLMCPDTMILDDREQAGPRPMTAREKNELYRDVDKLDEIRMDSDKGSN